jgi:alkaline phosphatase D
MPEEYIRQRFRMTKEAKGYKDIKRVIGVWDDHDYGINDADSNFEDKIRNRDIFLDFLDEPADTDRR